MTEQKYYTVHSVGKVEKVPMSAEMERLFAEGQKWWDEHGCKCEPCNTDHAIAIPRGHSVDVICGDCGGVLQVG